MKLRRRETLLRVASVAAVLLLAVGVVVTVTGGSSNKVVAEFADASPLENGNLVKINGVVVGRVTGIKLQDGHAAVTLQVSKSALPLHQDATATIRPISLLGERFIDLDPGTASAPLMSGEDTITTAHTGSAVNLDQVLNTLDDPTSAGLASLITSLGTGVDGQGTNIDQAIKDLVPTMSQAGQLTKILDQQNAVLNQLVSTASTGAQAFDTERGQALNQLVQKAEQTLSTVASERQALGSTLDQLPGTLTNAQATLAQLAGVADTTTPVLQSLKPVTTNLSQITSELHSFADAANPALAHLPAVLDKVNALLQAASPDVASLQPGSSSLLSLSQALLPLGNAVLDHPSGVMSTLDYAMNGLADWAMSTSSFDGVGHYFQAEAVLTAEPQELVGGLTAGTPLASGTTQSVVPAAAPAAGPAPASSSAPAGSLQQLVPNIANLLNPTGLTPSQQQNLLGQLLGGL